MNKRSPHWFAGIQKLGHLTSKVTVPVRASIRFMALWGMVLAGVAVAVLTSLWSPVCLLLLWAGVLVLWHVLVRHRVWRDLVSLGTLSLALHLGASYLGATFFFLQTHRLARISVQNLASPAYSSGVTVAPALSFLEKTPPQRFSLQTSMSRSAYLFGSVPDSFASLLSRGEGVTLARSGIDYAGISFPDSTWKEAIIRLLSVVSSLFGYPTGLLLALSFLAPWPVRPRARLFGLMQASIWRLAAKGVLALITLYYGVLIYLTVRGVLCWFPCTLGSSGVKAPPTWLLALGLTAVLLPLWFWIGVKLIVADFFAGRSLTFYHHLLEPESDEGQGELLPHQERAWEQIENHIREGIANPQQGQTLIAVEGVWGSGKSILMHWMAQHGERELAERWKSDNGPKDIPMVSFINVWRYESVPDLHFEIFMRLASHPRVLWDSSGWGWFFHLGISGAMKTLFSGMLNLQRFHLWGRGNTHGTEWYMEAVMELPWQHYMEDILHRFPVVFLVDELDRASTPVVQHTITLLRRSFDVPRTVVIFSYVPEQLDPKVFDLTAPPYSWDLESTKIALLQKWGQTDPKLAGMYRRVQFQAEEALIRWTQDLSCSDGSRSVSERERLPEKWESLLGVYWRKETMQEVESKKSTLQLSLQERVQQEIREKYISRSVFLHFLREDSIKQSLAKHIIRDAVILSLSCYDDDISFSVNLRRIKSHFVSLIMDILQEFQLSERRANMHIIQTVLYTSVRIVVSNFVRPLISSKKALRRVEPLREIQHILDELYFNHNIIIDKSIRGDLLKSFIYIVTKLKINWCVPLCDNIEKSRRTNLSPEEIKMLTKDGRISRLYGATEYCE